jgi:hypothetical protein
MSNPTNPLYNAPLVGPLNTAPLTKNDQIRAILNITLSFMQKRLHKNGKVYLVNINDRKVFFIDEEAVFNTVTQKAFYQNDLIISNQAIQAAKRILKDENDATPSKIHLRIGLGEHYYWIDFGDGSHFIAYSEEGAFFVGWNDNTIRFIDVDFLRPPELHSIPPISSLTRTTHPSVFGVDNKRETKTWLSKKHPYLEQILALTNVPEDFYSTVITWMICTLYPENNQTLLEIIGEENTGKSTTASIIKNLIDPSVITLEETPSSRKDLLSFAQNRYIIAIDNADELSNSIQQTVYELLTIGISHRTNHGNSGSDWAVNLRNPVITASTSSMLTNKLLAKNSISINLKNLKTIRSDQSIMDEFSDCRSQALLELAKIAADTLKNIRITSMTQNNNSYIDGFIMTGISVCKSLEIDKNKFIKTVNYLNDEVIDNLLDESIVAKSLHLWAIKNPSGNIEKPLNNWHKELIKNLPEEDRNKWPESARRFGAELKKIAPQIKKKGIVCKSLGKQGSNVRWRIRSIETL